MSPTLIIVLLLGILIIAAVAFALYKAGFTLDKLKITLGMVEAEVSRKDKPAQDKEPAPSTGPKVSQQAKRGGVIVKSGITVPAGSAAEIDQQAQGEESKIDESPIKLT